MGQARQSAEVEGAAASAEPSAPFLALARELQAEAQRWAAEPDVPIESLVEMFDSMPDEARRRAIETTFQNLPAEQRWAVLSRLFDDDRLRDVLAHERAVAVAAAGVVLRRAALVEDVTTRHLIDTRLVHAGDEIVLGLFRERDVRAALDKGPSSTSCARRVALQATDDAGVLHVVADVFNPFHGLFVTAEYDDRSWRDERLEPHTAVRVGAAAGPTFEPLVYPGGRFDVEVAGTVRPGRLHVGWATLGDLSLFPSTLKPASHGGNQP
jgi:hypothetical protein